MTNELLRSRKLSASERAREVAAEADALIRELIEKRISNRKLQEQINLKKIWDVRQNAPAEDRRLASFTLWRMSEDFANTPWYSDADIILAKDPLQICLMPEVLDALKPDKEYHLTARIISVDYGARTAVIEDPYQTITIPIGYTSLAATDFLTYLTVMKDGNSIRLTGAISMRILIESFNSQQDISRLAFPFDFEKIPAGKYYPAFKYAAESGVSNILPILFYLAKNEVNEGRLFEGENHCVTDYMNETVSLMAGMMCAQESDKDDWGSIVKRRRLFVQFPEEEMPPYNNVRVIENVNNNFTYLHMIHYDGNKHYFTRELHKFEPTRNFFKLSTPINFSMAMAQKPFMM